MANFVDPGEWGRGRGWSSVSTPRRRHLLAMDDDAALLERQVAMAASAWRHVVAVIEAYTLRH
jgi:hypothetical protein